MRLPLRTRQAHREPSPELLAEVDAGGWMYEWALTPSLSTPPLGPNLASVHRTRCEMIEPAVRGALAKAGPSARALDLACNEGWFSHRLLEWGAAQVVGLDARPENVHRAALLRDHFEIPDTRLTLLTADVFELDTAKLGTFDVVLVLGLIYHLERPLEAIRVARSLTRRLCVIESQLTRQVEPIVRGDGVPGVFHESPASFAAWVEDDAAANPRSAVPGVMSLVPNRAALEAMPIWAGFDRATFLPALPDHDVQYREGDRAIVAAEVLGG